MKRSSAKMWNICLIAAGSTEDYLISISSGRGIIVIFPLVQIVSNKKEDEQKTNKKLKR